MLYFSIKHSAQLKHVILYIYINGELVKCQLIVREHLVQKIEVFV